MKRGLGIAAAPLLLAGCGGGGETVDPDMAYIESEIDRGLTQQADQVVDAVDCPSSIEWKVGDDFLCTATVDGQNVPITVSMQNKEGEWYWRAG